MQLFTWAEIRVSTLKFSVARTGGYEQADSIFDDRRTDKSCLARSESPDSFASISIPDNPIHPDRKSYGIKTAKAAHQGKSSVNARYCTMVKPSTGITDCMPALSANH
jgi:hypothetical protein